MKGIYVRLPNRSWIRIKGILGGIVAGKSKKKTGYTLIAESIEKLDNMPKKPVIVFYISSTRVTKYIYRLLDRGLHNKALVVIEYVRPEIYKVTVYGSRVDEVYEVAEEMGIVRKVGSTS